MSATHCALSAAPGGVTESPGGDISCTHARLWDTDRADRNPPVVNISRTWFMKKSLFNVQQTAAFWYHTFSDMPQISLQLAVLFGKNKLELDLIIATSVCEDLFLCPDLGRKFCFVWRVKKSRLLRQQCAGVSQLGIRRHCREARTSLNGDCMWFVTSCFMPFTVYGLSFFALLILYMHAFSARTLSNCFFPLKKLLISIWV